LLHCCCTTAAAFILLRDALQRLPLLLPVISQAVSARNRKKFPIYFYWPELHTALSEKLFLWIEF
jgi:hypothetical protein